jgi:signal transduction histidine kinase
METTAPSPGSSPTATPDDHDDDHDKVNILLVDDQPARLLSYESVLSGLGQNLVRAHSGTEALERLMRQDFAVILLDVNMPGLDGFETARLIHNHPRFETTPIIFVTGVHVTELDQLQGYKLGAVDYVYIPVVPEILRGKVAVLVELYVKRRELEKLNRTLAQANTTLQADKNRELESLNRTLKQANAELEQTNHALQAQMGERVRIEEALKETDRRKDEFLAMLAHELRNPLAPILNAVQIMRHGEITDPQLLWSRDLIERQARHLTRLVDDLLDVSRITRGKINVTREPLEVAAVLSRAIETVQPLLAGREHRLDIEMPEQAPMIVGDLTRLTQALGNVLGNAAKYTAPGGHITVRVQTEDDIVVVSVSDNGIGIPAESISTVFDLFTQLDHSARRSQDGLGIGLALVKRLIELHGGTIAVHSAGLGLGSQFTIRLPVLNPSEATEGVRGRVAEPSAGAQPGERRRILVADDNSDALRSLSILLEINGHEVFTAADGAEAFEAAGRCKPQIALLDIGMPKMDGYEVARRIRTQPWGRSIVLVALTGWGRENDRSRSREAGFDSHLVKPFDPELLSEFIGRLQPESAGAG